MIKLETKDQIICANPDSIFNYFGWPSVTRLPDGTLAAVASGLRLQHVCPFGKGVICYSRDEGAHWTHPAIVFDTPLDDRDSGIVTFGKNRERVIMTTFNNTVAFQREVLARDPSPRGELMEAYLRQVTPELEEKYLGSLYKLSENGGYTFGSVCKVPVTAPHGPCCMPDGSLLYIGVYFVGEYHARRICCYRMEPDGNEFAYVSDMPLEAFSADATPCEVHTVALPDGKLVIHIRVESKKLFTLWQCESADGGKTFTQPRQIFADREGAPAHLLRHSSGVLICVYGHRTQPHGERVILSRDDGKTWSEPYLLRDDGPNFDLGYPATVELRDGSLLTVYYQHEPGADNAVIMQSRWLLP